MKRARWLLVALIVTASGVLLWRTGGRDRSFGATAAPGTLAVEWRGKHRGKAVLPARVNWCPVNRTAVLEAIAGDTGVAVVIYEANALTGGPHPVVLPGSGAAVPRPGASVVMRSPKDSTALLAFASQSGVVDLRLAPKLLSGTFSVVMRAASGNDSLTVAGNFTDVAVRTMAVGCP
jgi:hypothetical protein